MMQGRQPEEVLWGQPPSAVRRAAGPISDHQVHRSQQQPSSFARLDSRGQMSPHKTI